MDHLFLKCLWISSTIRNSTIRFRGRIYCDIALFKTENPRSHGRSFSLVLIFAVFQSLVFLSRNNESTSIRGEFPDRGRTSENKVYEAQGSEETKRFQIASNRLAASLLSYDHPEDATISKVHRGYPEFIATRVDFIQDHFHRATLAECLFKMFRAAYFHREACKCTLVHREKKSLTEKFRREGMTSENRVIGLTRLSAFPP